MGQEKYPVRLPKKALLQVNLGQSFAEYDKLLMQPNVFVETPAVRAAMDASRSKCFFVGRRGTGKTAITFYLMNRLPDSVIQLLPQVFGLCSFLDCKKLLDTKQRPFHTLVHCFQRALLDEILGEWLRRGRLSMRQLPTTLSRERNWFEDRDFDFRLLSLIESTFELLGKSEKEWLREVARDKEIARAMEDLRGGTRWDYLLIIDRIDESWDGNRSVLLLAALMHACVQLSGSTTFARPLLFLRENVFESVRSIDSEFTRLETCVVSVDWTDELLIELVERRLNAPFNTKLPLRGPTWDYFFEDGDFARKSVFGYCQQRPRDVLTYCSLAIEEAQSRNRERIQIEDLQSARLKFSESRLKDLGDEYSENFPQIRVLLSKFYGLAGEYTVGGIISMVQRLLLDDQIKQHCAKWFYQVSTPDQFIGLLYSIGFLGTKEGETKNFRSSGSQSSSPPPITPSTTLIVHDSYHDALKLRDTVISRLDDTIALEGTGLLADLPEATTLAEYCDRLESLEEDLKTLPHGPDHSRRYEEIIGQVIELCFFRSLCNIQPRERDVNGCVVRDWIAANRAPFGFWEMIRLRYQATQVVWECKNYAKLKSDDFSQITYYLNKEIGYFGVLCFRGETTTHYFEHVKRISNEKNALILLISDRDLQVFLRQARNGKLKEDHIQELYDRTVRAIS